MGQKVALAIGAGDGIGAAFARRFAQEGYSVVTVRRDPGKSRDIVEEIRAMGADLTVLKRDVRVEAEIVSLFEEVERDIGPIEVCLFNAGSNSSFPILDTRADIFRKIWELACFAGFVTGREAARHMVTRGRGTLLFTGASASLRGRAGFAAFASAKFGLRAIAQSLARELGPKGIHVAHVVIDAGVDMPEIHERLKTAGATATRLVSPSSVAEAFWQITQQSPDAWTHEMDLRPLSEVW